MLTRRFAFAFVVVLVALLSGACSVNQGGEITFTSPTSPSTETPTTPVVPMPDPANGDFQLVSTPKVTPGATGVLHIGDQWSAEYDSYCAAGLIRGVAFQRDDGKVLTDRNSQNCKGLGPYNFNYRTASVIDSSVMAFAGGRSLRVYLVTAKSISDWDRNEVQLHGDSIARWELQ